MDANKSQNRKVNMEEDNFQQETYKYKGHALSAGDSFNGTYPATILESHIF